MPSRNRRKELHWKRVQDRKNKEQEKYDSIIEETVEGQIHKEVPAFTDDEYIKVKHGGQKHMNAQTTPCVIS